MEQNYSEQGSLMWLLWGSLAVGVMFNQARGLDSQQASDLHHLWRLEFTGFKWSILSYLSLSSAAFTTVWVQLTLLIHTEYTLIKWTHSAHTCSWERSSTKSAKERRDKKAAAVMKGRRPICHKTIYCPQLYKTLRLAPSAAKTNQSQRHNCFSNSSRPLALL